MWRAAMRYSAVGLEMGLAIGGGYLLGWWLDGKYDTKPTLGLLGLLFGIVTAFRALYRVAKEIRLAEEAGGEQSDRAKRPSDHDRPRNDR